RERSIRPGACQRLGQGGGRPAVPGRPALRRKAKSITLLIAADVLLAARERGCRRLEGRRTTMRKPDLTGLTRRCLERPKYFLLFTGLLTAVFMAGLTRLELRTDGAALYPVGEPAVEETRRDSEVFHDPERIILMVSARPGGPAAASPAGFRAIKQLHASITRLRAVAPGGVKSLASLVEPLEGTAALVDVGHYLDVIPGEPARFAALLARLHAHPLVDGLFLSRNGRHAALYVSLDPRFDREAELAEVQRWLERQGRLPFTLRLTGPVVAEIELGHTVVRDLAWLTPLMALAIALLLFLSLRTLAAVAIAGAEVLGVMIWTLGAMGCLGVPITQATTILPVIMLSMTVDAEVHVLERAQARLVERDGDHREMGR